MSRRVQDNPPRFKHSLVLLTYNRPDLLNARLEEIFSIYSDRSDVELIIFDNASNELETRLVMTVFEVRQREENWKMKVVTSRVDENVGFGGGFNQATELALGEIVHLISDDVRIYGDFISGVEEKLVADRMIVGHHLVVGQAGWNEFEGQLPINYLSGHYLAMSRETWVELGGFDNETFYPYDYEDMDLTYRALKKGVAIQAVPELPLEHTPAGTIGYTNERYEHTVAMRAKFAEKWGLTNLPERP